jgi:hypothetical protein
MITDKFYFLRFSNSARVSALGGYDPVLELGLPRRLPGDLRGDLRRDDDHAFRAAEKPLG